jgi:hypothetical protein
MDLREALLRRAGLTDPTFVEVVNAIKSIPHGRPRDRSARGVVEDWRGTCSTKLLLLRELYPDVPMRFFNRVFRLTPDAALTHLGPEAADAVPPEGLIDVHTFARVGEDQLLVDLSLPGEGWDGTGDMAVAWGEGEDFEAGDDPIAHKESLVRKFGDPDVRDRFIRAFS